MNTPAHAVLNLALLSRGGRPAAPVLAGAVTPDAPMLLFYVWERLVAGRPEMVIWSERYFLPGWQDFFDVFNSLPLALAGLGLALWRRSQTSALFFASVVLHGAADLPLHRDDAHRHFWPFSDWRFESPVSYWDPAYYGMVASAGEALVVLLGTLALWRRFPGRAARVTFVAVNLLYVAGNVARLAWVQ